MKVVPLAADSMGVRSMATWIKTADCRILVDPAAAVGPKRFGLPPSLRELDELEKRRKAIAKYGKKSDIFVISHYHYDHHQPGDPFYKGKSVFAKSLKKHINRSQTKRGMEFGKVHGGEAEITYCDGKRFKVGGTMIKFSEPMPHGPTGTRLGYVVMTTIEGDETVMHASDVQGPMSARATREILRVSPDILIMDGPPTYMVGQFLSGDDMKLAGKNLLKIVERVGCEIILDHHLLRDKKYRVKMADIYKRETVKTAAEYIGEENNLLEASRRELYKEGD